MKHFLQSSILSLLIVFYTNTFSQIKVGQDIDGMATKECVGYSVSMPDINTIAVGSPGDFVHGTFASRVRVHRNSGSAWVQKGLDIDGEIVGDESGYSVSMPDSNTIAIGAPRNDGNGTDVGHARVYSWNGSAWIQKGIDIDGESIDDESGYSVSMPNANTIAIGALYNDGNGVDAGHVRVYSWNGNAWVQKGTDINGETAYDNSGYSVSMPDGNTIAIGAVGNDGSGNPGSDVGHVRIYSWNGSTWIQKGIDIDGEAVVDNFGWTVSMPDANTIAIGAPHNDANLWFGSDFGHVRIYSWNGNTWIQKGLDIDGEAAGDQSGWSVSMPDANTITIGAIYNSGNGTNAGHVRVYSWNGGAWIQEGIDIDGETALNASGYSVSMFANTVAVGAPFNSGNGYIAGQVRVYKQKGVHGFVFNDINENCVKENEPGLLHRLAIINPGNIIVETNTLGRWIIDSLSAGTYTVTYDVPANWRSNCPVTQIFTVVNPDAMTHAPDFGMVSTQPCAGPDVSINMPRMRPCFTDQKIYVNASNKYTATGALNTAYVVVELDSLIIPTSASLSYTILGNNLYRFNLGNINPGQSINFTINATVNCSTMVGKTLCMEALLYPANPCVFDTIPATPSFSVAPCTLPWDHSSLNVDGWCDNDTVHFTVTNHGSGNMQCYAPVRVYIDGVLIDVDSVLLASGQTKTYSYSGNGQTWILQADQHPLHPGNSHPNAHVEACGNLGNWTPSLVNDLPLDDADPIVDIYCDIARAAYDPNDKTGFPMGLGTSHDILPNQQLQYMVRFQNTGSDTAFTVVVRDTLDVDLDIFSVTPGVASHNYSFRMYGPRVLEWTFNNILLPDSTTNEPGSHGFLTFTVNQKKNLPNGTTILNEADIYFDFNAPVITNTANHTINNQLYTTNWAATDTITNVSCTPYTFNGITYTKTGTYWQVIDGIANADTLLTLNITVKNTYSNLVVSTCNTYTAPDGIVYNTSGIKTAVVPNAAGCDSTITVNLKINRASSSSIAVSACDSYTAPDGLLYSTSGTKTAIIPNVAGCDSVITIYLNIKQATSSTITTIACSSYTAPDGVVYNSSGIKTAVIPNVIGCDSVITIDLSLKSTSSTITANVCNTYMAPDGVIYTTSGIKTAIVPNAAGCDSVITINLTVNYDANINQTITQNDVVLISNTNGAVYQWIDCSTNQPIANATQQQYTATVNGNYAVIISLGECKDTSACVTVSTVGLKSINESIGIKLSPNPNNGHCNLDFGEIVISTEVSITNVMGQAVGHYSFNNTSSADLVINGESGVYFLKIISGNKTANMRVVKM